MEYSKEELLKMYKDLVRGRIFTEKMHQAVNDGLIRLSYHSAYGEEATSVGVVSALRSTDWIVQSHRVQPASIMRLDLYKFICELFGKRDGQNMGTGYDFHLCDMKGSGHLGVPMATLGSVVPMYVGFAWALKYQKKDQVAVVFQGDGALSEGVCYESFNIASLYHVPMILVINNNGWAMTTPLSRQSVNPDISDRAKPFHIPTQIVDGSNLLEIREAMDKAVALARDNQFNVVEVKNLRWGAHFVGQKDDYRDDLDVIEDAKAHKDCVKLYEDELLRRGLIDQAFADSLRAQCSAEIDEAVRRAAQAPYPTFEEVYPKNHIYAMPETGGEL